MDWWFYSLWDLLPVPILIGMFIWTFSMCLFSVFLLVIVVLLHRRTTPIAELISMRKDLSALDTTPKGGFSCDSLSLISLGTTHNDNDDPISSFYLRNCQCIKENEKLHSLPAIKLRPTSQQEKYINTLPAQLSTRRSIIRDLTSVSNSFTEKKTHQSIDSLFSKDSLVE